MAHFKFLIDQGVHHLAEHFPPKRVVTLKTLGLREDTSDDDILDAASVRKWVLVTANRRDFLSLARAYVAKSTKKTDGCHRVPGMILIVPNDAHSQHRALNGLENRLVFEGKKITWSDVHDRDLLVQIEANGTVKIERLPRCPHCNYDDEE
jgi:uncharacterized protein DUF5615